MATDTILNRFMYFPTDYRWSAGFDLALGSAPFGGADIGELDRAGRALRGCIGDDEAWFREFRTLGEQVQGIAINAELDGRRFTAASAYLRACNYYQVGERFQVPKTRGALALYEQSINCFQRFTRLTDRPRVELIEMPFEGDSLPGYFVHAENSDLQRKPCLVFFDGLDISKELCYLRGVPDLVRRGISCLLLDAPGNGEAVRFRGMPLRHDWERPGGAALNYLATRPDVDAERIGIMAISLGGYFAPRAAALDPRFKACVAWGAQWDYHAVWQRRVEDDFSTPHSVPDRHLTWVLGVATIDQALERLRAFRLDGLAQRVRCPFLLVHGELDEQIGLETAHTLFNAVGSADKTLRIFTEEEGGAQHCQSDYLTHGTSVIWDWLAEKL